MMTIPAGLFTDTQIREFWGVPDLPEFGLQHIKGVCDRLMWVAYPIYNKDKNSLHIGGISEMCEYFKVPYPKTVIETWKHEEVAKLQKSGKDDLERMREMSLEQFPEDAKAGTDFYLEWAGKMANTQQWMDKHLREAIVISTMEAMRADHPNQLRARAFLGILKLQLNLSLIQAEAIAKAFAAAQ